MTQENDRLPDEPNESNYEPITDIKVSVSDETLAFVLSLRTVDGGIHRFKFQPNQARELMAWFLFVAGEQERKGELDIVGVPKHIVPAPITHISGEAGRAPGEALLYATAGQITLAMPVGLADLISLRKWIDDILKFDPNKGEGGKA
jgi:hypothetical protein